MRSLRESDHATQLQAGSTEFTCRCRSRACQGLALRGLSDGVARELVDEKFMRTGSCNTDGVASDAVDEELTRVLIMQHSCWQAPLNSLVAAAPAGQTAALRGQIDVVARDLVDEEFMRTGSCNTDGVSPGMRSMRSPRESVHVHSYWQAPLNSLGAAGPKLAKLIEVDLTAPVIFR